MLLIVDIDSSDWGIGAITVSHDELTADTPSSLLVGKLSMVIEKNLGKPVNSITFDNYPKRVDYGVSLTFEADGLLCHATIVELFD